MSDENPPHRKNLPPPNYRGGSKPPRKRGHEPNYTGKHGGTVQPPQISSRRATSSPRKTPDERPECAPVPSTFRPHPNRPTYDQPETPDVRALRNPPNYVSPPPRIPAFEAPPPPVDQADAPEGVDVRALRNPPNYVRPPASSPGTQSTEPRYVNPPPQGGGSRGLPVTVNHVPGPSHAPPPAQPSQPAHSSPPPPTAPRTIEELQEAAESGDQEAAALLRQLGDESSYQNPDEG